MIDNINLNKRESKNTVNKNKLFIGYEQKKKSFGDFISELNFSSDSFDSNSFNSSNFKITNSISIVVKLMVILPKNSNYFLF